MCVYEFHIAKGFPFFNTGSVMHLEPEARVSLPYLNPLAFFQDRRPEAFLSRELLDD